MNKKRINLTMLNCMGGRVTEKSFDRHVEYGLKYLDLKDCLFGKSVENLMPEEAKSIKEMTSWKEKYE